MRAGRRMAAERAVEICPRRGEMRPCASKSLRSSPQKSISAARDGNHACFSACGRYDIGKRIHESPAFAAGAAAEALRSREPAVIWKISDQVKVRLCKTNRLAVEG